LGYRRSATRARRRGGRRGGRDRRRQPRLGRLQAAAPRRASEARHSVDLRGVRTMSVAASTHVQRSIQRLEARPKVPRPGHHLPPPGMLYGKIFRSTVPHGRIKRIDTAKAKAVPGVHRVVTIDDVRTVIPNPYYGPAFHDQPILADGKVRYAGEPVAVVLAA